MGRLVILSLLLGFVFTRQAYLLTEENFEHDTQATTGGTTGDWVVLFCSPKRFEVCNETMPVWEELADELYGKVSVAFVDT